MCAVYTNRETGEFATTRAKQAAETASLAVALLAKMDAAKATAGVDRWHSGLSLE